MLNKLKKLFQQFSKLGGMDWLELLFHPVLLPFMLLSAWAKSLWASRILLWGQWSRYHGFNVHNAINSLYYRTQWININRYGRLVNSSILGLGNFSLSNWWYLSSLASYFYANAGAVTTLLGAITLVFTHLLWLQTNDAVWVSIVTVILFFSSTMYAMAFARQNYQILAWLFMPVMLYGLLNEQWVIATAALLASSVLGITAFVVGTLLVIVTAVNQQQPLILFVLLPSIVAVVFKLTPLFINGSLKCSLLNIGKLIGLIHVKVRYKRTSMQWSLFNIYFIMLYGLGLTLIWLGKGEAPLYFLTSYLLFVFNQRIVRFADDQSVIIVATLAAAVEVLIAPFNGLALLGLIVISNPMTILFQAGSYAIPKVFVPFDIEKVLVPMRNFLDIPKNSKVYFAFNEPDGVYENIFDGFRVLLEAPLVVAAEKEIHLFPDWYAVLETNNEEAPPIWGRSIKDVKTNLAYWKAGYVVAYQNSGEELSSDWCDSFEVISELDWIDILDEATISNIISTKANPPKWWLLKTRVS